MNKNKVIIISIIAMIAGSDVCWGMKGNVAEIKVVFVGDAGVGKTQIVNRITWNKFNDEYNETIGMNKTTDVELSNKKEKLKLLDTSGHKKCRILIPLHLKDSHIVVFVYDITNKESFENIGGQDGWLQTAQNANLTTDNCIFVLVGNKTDLVSNEGNERAVTTEEAQNYATEKGMLFYEVSAKDDESMANFDSDKGSNGSIAYMVNEIAQEALKKGFYEDNNSSKNEEYEEQNNNSKCGCCCCDDDN